MANNTTNDMIKTAQLEEMAIVYGNRYRSSYEEIDIALTKAEELFRRGKYKESLDLSTKSSGWALFEAGNLKDWGCIASSSTDLIKRIYIMRDGIQEILSKSKIDKIIVEEVRPEGGYGVGNQKTHRALMWLQAAIAFMVYDFDKKIEIEYIYPSSWRATCGIKNGRGIVRSTLKEADIAFVKDKYGLDVNDDIADAICIGLAQYLEQDNNEINWG